MKIHASLCCLLISVSLLTAGGLAQPLEGTIRGQVVTSAGSPQPDVRVTAINQETGEVRKPCPDKTTFPRRSCATATTDSTSALIT